MPGVSVYAATKAAVVSLTTSVNAETPRRVRVHAVCPDGVDTDGAGLLGTSRVVRSLPGWRGGLVRTAALAPSISQKALPLVHWMGRRGMRRQG